jgi:hypothetical protein
MGLAVRSVRPLMTSTWVSAYAPQHPAGLVRRRVMRGVIGLRESESTMFSFFIGRYSIFSTSWV